MRSRPGRDARRSGTWRAPSAHQPEHGSQGVPERLVEAGVLEDRRRGEGTFVAERPPSMPAAERSRTLREGALRYASLALNLGASRTEATTVLGTAWPDGDERGGRK